MLLDLYFSGQEGGGVAQVVDPEGEERTEYPPQGLRDDSGAILVILHSVFVAFEFCIVRK